MCRFSPNAPRASCPVNLRSARAMAWPSLRKPSTVRMDFPSAFSACVRQERTGLPSIRMVQMPQRPSPQPTFVPVNPNLRRNRSDSLSPGWLSTSQGSPLRVKCSILNIIPLGCRLNAQEAEFFKDNSILRRCSVIQIQNAQSQGLNSRFSPIYSNIFFQCSNPPKAEFRNC